MGEDNHADAWAAFNNPAVVRGMCEDYRAGLGIDRDRDEADRKAGRQVTCPTLLLASVHDDLDIHGDPAAIRAPWLAGPLRHRTIHCGHHQVEEAPGPVAEAMLCFLSERQ
jgi:haloacetate dehalogenase